MFNTKKKLFHYMKEKNSEVERLTDISLYDDIDYEDFEHVSHRDRKRCLKDLKEEIYTHTDAGACPQCLLNTENQCGLCAMCDYGSNHGLCEDEKSRYRSILCRLPLRLARRQDISDAIGWDVLIKLVEYL